MLLEALFGFILSTLILSNGVNSAICTQCGVYICTLTRTLTGAVAMDQPGLNLVPRAPPWMVWSSAVRYILWLVLFDPQNFRTGWSPSNPDPEWNFLETRVSESLRPGDSAARMKGPGCHFLSFSVSLARLQRIDAVETPPCFHSADAACRTTLLLCRPLFLLLFFLLFTTLFLTKKKVINSSGQCFQPSR